MSHEDKGWQAHYARPDMGQQYRCIKCGNGGASGQDHKPLTYHCHNEQCKGQHTMWPTPQYALYREQVLEVERLKALSVTNIMIDVTPGDGDGREVYAKSVAQVEEMLTKLWGENELLQRRMDLLGGDD